ncbi:MATE family efflux transporter [Pelagibacterales bacterium SAG-MED31]|nr:MATE family efflux transporter [Pelagibacterales bacterium SAG-MED31]
MSDRASIRNIVKLSIPIFFANLVIPLVAIVDTGLMGNLDNASYLTATSIATSVFSLIFWSFGFLRMGTVGLVAQAHGSNQYEEIVNLVFQNIAFVIIISLLLVIFQKYIFTIALSIFDLSNQTSKHFKEYFEIRIYSSFGELIIFIITGLFIGLQRTTISSVVVGFFSISNIVLSLLFVIYFDLDVRGVALGTVISSTLTTIIFLSYTFFELKKFTSIKINVAKIFNLKKIQKLFSINLDIFIRSALLTFSFIFFTYLGNTISEDIVAANTILLNLIMLSAFILDAYAFSTEGIVGYSIGSKNKTLLTNVIKNSFILSASTGLFISLIFLVGKDNFISIMTNLPDIKNLSFSYSYWVVIIPFISCFCFQFDGIFIGASQTKELRNAMIVSVSIYIVCALFLAKTLGNSGLWISLSIFFGLRALTLFFYLNKIYKKIE